MVFVKLNNYFGVKVIWRGGVNKIIVVKDFILFFCGGLGVEPLPHYYLHESVIGANVVRAHERFPCGGRRSGH